MRSLRDPRVLLAALGCALLHAACVPDDEGADAALALDAGDGDAGVVDAGAADTAVDATYNHAMAVDQTAVLTVLERDHLDFGTNVFTQVEARVTFLATPLDTEAYPYAVGGCTSANGLTSLSIAGVVSGQDVGDVALVADSGRYPLAFNGGHFEAEWSGTAGDLGPWQVATWYDLEQSEPPAFTLPDAQFTTTSALAILAPASGARVDLDVDLDITWLAADATRVVLVLGRLGASDNLVCASDDDGAFTVPAASLTTIAGGSGTLMLQLLRVYSFRLVRSGRLVHMIATENVGHTLTE